MLSQIHGDRVLQGPDCLPAGSLVGEDTEVCTQHVICLAHGNSERKPVARRSYGSSRDPALTEPCIDGVNALLSGLDERLRLFAALISCVYSNNDKDRSTHLIFCQVLTIVGAIRIANIVQGVNEPVDIILGQRNAKLKNRLRRSGGCQGISGRDDCARLMNLQVTLRPKVGLHAGKNRGNGHNPRETTHPEERRQRVSNARHSKCFASE